MTGTKKRPCACRALSSGLPTRTRPDGITDFGYFLVVGHMQFVGILSPTQTLPWQNAILPVDFTVPDPLLGVFIYGTFLPFSASLIVYYSTVMTMKVVTNRPKPCTSSLPDEVHEIIVGSEPHEPFPGAEVRRNGGDPEFPGPLPVGIDRRGKASRREDLPRPIPRKPHGLGNPHELVHPGDVPPLDEKSPVDRFPVRVSLSLRFRPFPQLLGPPAVEGPGPLREWHPLGLGQLAQPRLHGRDLFLPPGKQLGELDSLLRRFRVERKNGPAQLHSVLPLQAVGTHGTEVAPGSDVVKEDLDDGRRVHVSPP